MIVAALKTMSPVNDATRLTVNVNVRCMNLLPFRLLAANDSDQSPADLAQVDVSCAHTERQS